MLCTKLRGYIKSSLIIFICCHIYTHTDLKCIVSLLVKSGHIPPRNQYFWPQKKSHIGKGPMRAKKKKFNYRNKGRLTACCLH